MFNLAYFRDTGKFRFFTFAGVQEVRIAGEVISGQFRQNLIELPEKPKNLLASFVNWPDDPKSIMRFTRKYGPLQITAIPSQPFSFDLKEFSEAQAYFRRIWIDPGKCGDWEQKEGCLRFRGGAISYTATSLFAYFQCEFFLNQRERFKMCKGEECLHPYFFATHLKKEFCSAECADTAQRSAKRNYWERTGQILRTERREKARKHTAEKQSKTTASK